MRQHLRRYVGRRLSSRLIATIVLLIGLVATTGAGPAFIDPGSGAFGVVGNRPERGSFSTMPFDRIDTVNGNLTLTFTDLVLPGNAGMDLRITRTYNHNKADDKWTFGFSGVPIKVSMPSSPDVPMLYYPDGAEQLFSGVSNYTGYYVTSGFARYDATAHTLEMPNGWVATYDSAIPSSNLRVLTKIEDPYGNSITPAWNTTTW